MGLFTSRPSERGARRFLDTPRGRFLATKSFARIRKAAADIHVEATTLRQFVDTHAGTITPLQCLFIVRDVCQDLVDLHHAPPYNWAHLDVRPETIAVLTTEPPRANVIVEEDHSRRVFEDRYPATRYSPPYNTERAFSSATDVFAVGVIAAELAMLLTAAKANTTRRG